MNTGRRLPALRLFPVLIVLACAAVAFGIARHAAADSAYDLTASARYCNALSTGFPDPALAGTPACAEDLGAGNIADLTLSSNLPAGSLMTDSSVAFFPQSASVTAGNALSVGAKVGGVETSGTYGLLNGVCNTLISANWVLYNVALPGNMGNPRASANLAYPRNQGEADRFGAWAVGAPPANGAPENIPDANADSIADAGAIPVQNYPAFLLDAFDADFVPGVGDNADGGADSTPLVPQAVYGGLAKVAGGWRLHYVVVFQPGQLTSLPGAYGKMFTPMGWPAVVVTGDPTEVTPAPDAMTDVCSPYMDSTMLLGLLPGGFVWGTNPGAGTQYTGLRAVSGRDLDQDGIENALDTCPKNVDLGADADSDGIDDVCDPSNAFPSDDEDLDAWKNRGDNCPLATNSAQAEAERSVPGTGANADLGPKQDSMGDACDAGSAVTITQNNKSLTITPSNTVGNGRYHLVMWVLPKCFGGTDADGDGYCTTQDLYDSGMCAGTVPPSCTVRHNPWPLSLRDVTMSIDTDGDNFTDAVETYLSRNEFCVTSVGHTPASCGGSAFVPRVDALHSCAQTTGAVGSPNNDERPWDNWPFDYNDNGISNSLDISTFVPVAVVRLNKPVNMAPADERWDLNNDGMVNTLDIGFYTIGSPTHLSRTCASDVPPVPPFSQQ